MKRCGNLWSEVIAFENLLCSARKAQRGKRFKRSVLAFNDNLEHELFTLETACVGCDAAQAIYETSSLSRTAAPHHLLCHTIPLGSHENGAVWLRSFSATVTKPQAASHPTIG